MANEKRSVYKCRPMTDGKCEIIQKLLQEYDIQDAGSLQEVLKDLLGSTIKSMMEAEMDDLLGCITYDGRKEVILINVDEKHLRRWTYLYQGRHISRLSEN